MSMFLGMFWQIFLNAFREKKKFYINYYFVEYQFVQALLIKESHHILLSNPSTHNLLPCPPQSPSTILSTPCQNQPRSLAPILARDPAVKQVPYTSAGRSALALSPIMYRTTCFSSNLLTCTSVMLSMWLETKYSLSTRCVLTLSEVRSPYRKVPGYFPCALLYVSFIRRSLKFSGKSYSFHYYIGYPNVSLNHKINSACPLCDLFNSW